MLTVYGTHGSPGASTTAMHLAAHWASTGHEVLLIEADPNGGSLSHTLGIQFTPGSASFVSSGLPVLSNHLIDHAQDVLFENLHVMPAPASLTGARGVVDTFAGFAEDLRAISENEMAVIIDGGRITAGTAASKLTTVAAGVVVVCHGNNHLPSLDHLRDVLAADTGTDRPQGCAVTVGKSSIDPDEWRESCGLTYCGSIEMVADMTSDLSSYLTRGKRKSKKWRASLEQVGQNLYPHAHPPVSDVSRRRQPVDRTPPSETETAEGAEQAATASMPSQAQDPAGYGQPPPAPPEPMPDFAQPMEPGVGAGYGQSHFLPPTPQAQPDYSQSDYGQSDLLPPYQPPQYQQPPHEQSPPEGYQQPQYQQPAHEQSPPGGYQQPQYQQPAHEQSPPGGYQQPQYQQPAHEQSPPGGYQQPQYQPPAHEQSPPGGYQQPQYQPPAHEQSPPGAYQQPYEQPQYQQPAHEQSPPGAHQQPQYQQPQYQQPPHEQSPPGGYQQPGPSAFGDPPLLGERPGSGVLPLGAEPPRRPYISPTGSFRDWAVKLHDLDSRDATAHRRGV